MKDEINIATNQDIAHALSKGIIGSIPVVGSLATEIFALIVTPPLEKRRAQWMNDIAEKLKNLEEQKRINLDELKENDEFIDIILQATTFALKTSEEIKIDAFRSAVVNAAIGESPDKIKSHIFLTQLNRFTTWHILLLGFINNPVEWLERNNKTQLNLMMGSLHSVIIDVFPELKGNDELLDIIWNDLESSGFHNSGSIKTMMSGGGLYSARITKIGKEFISFITDNQN